MIEYRFIKIRKEKENKYSIIFINGGLIGYIQLDKDNIFKLHSISTWVKLTSEVLNEIINFMITLNN